MLISNQMSFIRQPKKKPSTGHLWECLPRDKNIDEKFLEHQTAPGLVCMLGDVVKVDFFLVDQVRLDRALFLDASHFLHQSLYMSSHTIHQCAQRGQSASKKEVFPGMGSWVYYH